MSTYHSPLCYVGASVGHPPRLICLWCWILPRLSAREHPAFGLSRLRMCTPPMDHRWAVWREQGWRTDAAFPPPLPWSKSPPSCPGQLQSSHLEFLLPEPKPQTDFLRISGHGPRHQYFWKLPRKMRAAQVKKLLRSGSRSSLSFALGPTCPCLTAFALAILSAWNHFPGHLPMAVFLRGFSSYLISSSYSFLPTLRSLYWIITIFSYHLWLAEMTYLLMWLLSLSSIKM